MFLYVYVCYIFILFSGSDEKLDELKIIFLEEEIKDLKKTLREEHARNAYLAGMLDQAEKQQKSRL